MTSTVNIHPSPISVQDAALPSKRYFSALNYSLANEDTEFELELARREGAQAILTVCGSGGRSLPFLALAPERLDLVDLAGAQLLYAEVKAQTLASLTHEEYLLFWGFPPFSPEENRGVRQHLFSRLDLRAEVREFFSKVLISTEYQSPIYHGKWEIAYTGIPKNLRRIFGPRLARFYDALFQHHDLPSQRAFVRTALANRLWQAIPKALLLAFGNAHYFNAALYKGAMMEKNIPGSRYKLYRRAFIRAMTRGLARENFFLQLTFFGRLVYPEGNPPEAAASLHAKAKAALAHTKLRFLQQSIIPESSATQHTRYDFVSLSDVPSYFRGAMEQQYLQMLRPTLLPGAVVVVRCYLRIPEGTNTQGFSDISAHYQELIDREKTQMYRIFVYRYTGEAS